MVPISGPGNLQYPSPAPEHSHNLVIGSGFGASVTALRLAESGSRVTMLERGSRWPRDPWRKIFSNDTFPDGRAQWFRNSFTGLNGIPVYFDRFGGVLDVTQYQQMQVWRGAAVGGGSIVFTGVLIQPERRFFDSVFTGRVNYDEMDQKYYPLARKMLDASPVPPDIYSTAPFGHSRVWDAQAAQAGYTPNRSTPSLSGIPFARSSPSAREHQPLSERATTVTQTAQSTTSLQNYLAQAEATSRVTIHPRHVVRAIAQQTDGKFWVQVDIVEPDGTLTRSRTLTCNRLFLGAGSIGTSELLVRARSLGTLPRLNQHVGEGWGNNGDAALMRTFSLSPGLTQASPSASRILDESGMPLSLENWYIPGLPVNIGLLGSLAMTLNPTRASFRYDHSTSSIVLDWPSDGVTDSNDALRAVHNHITQANGVNVGFPPFAADVNSTFTAHPLGGAVLGLATDTYGRVHGHNGLYVVDAAVIPGSTGTVNPSLTVTALAERAIENIITRGS
ncbi:GMC oxidoreductase [Lysinibacter sp. HNR]|uniref:GMC oxidoreductase n=1 Tax=Lysinibacter sp. HNR TaxID=3031408 RepID=UPI002435930A|nr:GMC oxidoreductase [Lysinibacter sp. HNR]WGD37964.1 GMC oxidoreductase [Lysinibacter sp. HNR]